MALYWCTLEYSDVQLDFMSMMRCWTDMSAPAPHPFYMLVVACVVLQYVHPGTILRLNRISFHISQSAGMIWIWVTARFQFARHTSKAQGAMGIFLVRPGAVASVGAGMELAKSGNSMPTRVAS